MPDEDRCEHGRIEGRCRWCDKELYDTTCWWYAGEIRSAEAVPCGGPGQRVHKRCLAKAEKYRSDKM